MFPILSNMVYFLHIRTHPSHLRKLIKNVIIDESSITRKAIFDYMLQSPSTTYFIFFHEILLFSICRFCK